MKNSFFASLVLLVSMPVHALVGGVADLNTTDSPWAGVGAVSVNGGTFSGALIDSQYVLTAAHVVGGQVSTPGNVSFTLNAGGAASHVIAAASIVVFPGFTGTTPGPDKVWHDDLALIRLAAPVDSSVSSYGLYDGTLDGKILTLVGYGASGDGKNGISSSANPNVKRVGQNRVDVLHKDDDGGSASEVFVFDFDGGDATSNVFGNPIPRNLTLGADIEAQFAGGDSGSPVFVKVGNAWKIAGIATFNGSTSLSSASNVLFGSIGGGTVVAPYLPWITSTLAAPVPELHVWLMLLVGMGLVGATRLRFQSGRYIKTIGRTAYIN